MSKPLDPTVKAVNVAQKAYDTIVKKIEANKAVAATLAADKAKAADALKKAKEAAKAVPKKK